MFLKLFSAIILGVRNFRVFEILEHLPYLHSSVVVAGAGVVPWVVVAATVVVSSESQNLSNSQLSHNM